MRLKVIKIRVFVKCYGALALLKRRGKKLMHELACFLLSVVTNAKPDFISGRGDGETGRAGKPVRGCQTRAGSTPRTKPKGRKPTVAVVVLAVTSPL